MEAETAAGRELVVERAAHERVREPVLRGATGHGRHESGALGGFERIEHCFLCAIGERREQTDFELASDNRRPR